MKNFLRSFLPVLKKIKKYKIEIFLLGASFFIAIFSLILYQKEKAWEKEEVIEEKTFNNPTPLNITEGNARQSEKEKKQFLNFAYSSLKEVKYLLYFSKDIDLISEEVYQDIFKKIDEIGGLIYGLIKTLRGKI